MKYTKTQKRNIEGFASLAEYKEFIAKKYKLGNREFKVIDGFIVIKSSL